MHVNENVQLTQPAESSCVAESKQTSADLVLWWLRSPALGRQCKSGSLRPAHQGRGASISICVYPALYVCRSNGTDSSSSSIRRLCRNTPSGGLVGAAPLGVASVYGHSPFAAASVARRGKPAWGPSHMLVFPHTSPSEHVVLGNKCAHRCPCHAALRALDAVRCPLRSSEVLCSAACAKDRKN